MGEQPRSPEQQAEYDAAWWELEMDASVWWSLSKVSAMNAAMLLCGFNPNAPDAGDPENVTKHDDASRQTGPSEFRRLRTVLCDVEEASPQARTLAQWLQIARDRGLTIHSWIVEWLAATGNGAPLSSPASEIAAEEISSPRTQVLLSGISSPDIAAAFDGLNGWDEAQWKRYLADPPKWLESARMSKGRKQAGGSATWNPVILAAALYDKYPTAKKDALLLKLDAVFKKRGMKDWAPTWDDSSELMRG
ncbi:hypothetical protein D9M70_512550 [compost metagenome]